MRYVASRVAAELARQQQGDTPVILMGQVEQDCRTIPNATSFDDEQIFFLVTYIERSHAFCIIEYGLATNVNAQGAITLSEDSGRNYGARIQSPVRVVPIGHVFKVLPDFVLSLMDWRTKLPASAGNVTFDSQTETSSSGPVSRTDLNINFFEIRAALARRHGEINLILDTALAALSLMMLASLAWVRVTYKTFRRCSIAYGYDLSVWQYFCRNPDSLILRVEHEHRLSVERTQVKARAEELARRAHRELRHRLGAWLESPINDTERETIVNSLNQDSEMQMASLLHELEARPKSPEERLAQLLEPLKEYCDADEFKLHKAEALNVFQRLGFRPARDFAVRLYENLKIAARNQDAEGQKTNDSL